MNKNFWWAWAIKNSICVICWTAIAIIFNKWWIALFGLLFMHSIKSETSSSSFIRCNECGKYAPFTQHPDDPIYMVKQQGWVSYKENGEWKDYCPDCQDKNTEDKVS